MDFTRSELAEDILLVLSSGDQYGFRVKQVIEIWRNCDIPDSRFYKAFDKLKNNFIEESGEQFNNGRVRQYFKLTLPGKNAVQQIKNKREFYKSINLLLAIASSERVDAIDVS